MFVAKIGNKNCELKDLIAIRKIGIGNRLLHNNLSGIYEQKLLAIKHV